MDTEASDFQPLDTAVVGKLGLLRGIDIEPPEKIQIGLAELRIGNLDDLAIRLPELHSARHEFGK